MILHDIIKCVSREYQWITFLGFGRYNNNAVCIPIDDFILVGYAEIIMRYLYMMIIREIFIWRFLCIQLILNLYNLFTNWSHLQPDCGYWHLFSWIIRHQLYQCLLAHALLVVINWFQLTFLLHQFQQIMSVLSQCFANWYVAYYHVL